MAETNGPADQQPPKTTRVLIVDDHELLRDGLRLLIDNAPDLEICGEAADETGAMLHVRQRRPGVAVVDISLQNGSGLELVKWMHKHHPGVKSIISTMHDERVYGERACAPGPMGLSTSTTRRAPS